MPRLGRVVLPNYPHHVVQRGHNKQLVFAEDADYRYYLDTLATFKGLLDIKVYAFCLMSNHVHLIVQPGEAIAELGGLMKHLAGRQTRFVTVRPHAAARSGKAATHPVWSRPTPTCSPAAAMWSSTRYVRG
jgi:putative transposase